VRRARVRMSQELLFAVAFRDFPEGTNVSSVRISDDGFYVEFVVDHDDLHDVGAGEPPIVRPEFTKGPDGQAVFKDWGQA
jgi:hypothetical protein